MIDTTKTPEQYFLQAVRCTSDAYRETGKDTTADMLDQLLRIIEMKDEAIKNLERRLRDDQPF